MKSIFLTLGVACVFLTSCIEQKETKTQSPSEKTPDSFVRVNTTLQQYNEVQPWDLKEPYYRNGLGTVIGDNKILTTAEMVDFATFIELESADGSQKVSAKVSAIDFDSNLAILVPEQEENFTQDLAPIKFSKQLKKGDSIQVIQLERNGDTTITPTNIHGVDTVLTHSNGKSFISYLLKGSLQSASNSYTVPVVNENTLAGLITSYDSNDQISEVVPSQIIELFLKDYEDGTFNGFPSLGIAASGTEDPHLREWLQLAPEDGGVFVTRVAPDSAAEKAGIEKEDVLLSIDSQSIDQKGYFDSKQYGKLFWTHLIRGNKLVGDTVSIQLKRKGEKLTIEAELTNNPQSLVPAHTGQNPSEYFMKGGIIFQVLTQNYLKIYGKDWSSRAPLSLLDTLYHPEKYEKDTEQIVIISGVIPSRVTIGYDKLRNYIVKEVNGQVIKNIKDLKAAFENHAESIHSIKLSDPPSEIFIDAALASQVDQGLLKQGLPALERIHE